jgi:glutamine amidotransferase
MMHNGYIGGLSRVRRDLALAVDPSLFPEIEGTTDTELLFHLALTYGLQEDPPAAMAQAVGLVEAIGRRHGVEYPIQMTVVTTDGDAMWAFRYSSEGRSRSLFHSTDVSTLRAQYPDNAILDRLSDDARLIVSEPLGDLKGAWREVPEATCVMVHGGREEMRPFVPVEPQVAVGAPSPRAAPSSSFITRG